MKAVASPSRFQAAWANFVADIKAGENVELYVLVALSFVFTVCGFFVGPVQGVAFGVGTLYVSQAIRDRHRTARLDERVCAMIETVEALIERIDSPALDLEVTRMRTAAASPSVLPKGATRK